MKKIILIALLFSACSSPEALLKRAIKKGAKVKIDTVKVIVEKVTPEVKTDSVFISKPGDTVYINKEKLKIKYVKLPGDSVFIEGKCEKDTLRIEVPVAVTTDISAGYEWWIVLGVGIFGFGLCFFIFTIVMRLKNRAENPPPRM